MSTYETISLLIGFGMFILSLISLITVIVKLIIKEKK